MRTFVPFSREHKMLFNLFTKKKMKKVIVFFAVATAVALASCGGQQAPAEPAAAEEAPQTEEVALPSNDSITVSEVAAEAAPEVAPK